MFKKINIPGMAILMVILLIMQFGVGVFISPIIGAIVLDKVSAVSPAKIEAGSIHIWPLTLSMTVNDLNIFEPGKEHSKMLHVDKAGFRVSIMGLLAKRIVMATTVMTGAEIFLEENSDGTLNVEKIIGSAASGESEKAVSGSDLFNALKNKKDWIGKAYDKLKDRTRGNKEKSEKARQERISTTVVEMPNGKRVEFRDVRKDYLFSINRLKVRNAKIHMKDSQDATIIIDKVNVNMDGLAFDPKKGSKIDDMHLNGRLMKNGKDKGDFSLDYRSRIRKAGVITDIALKARDLDMGAVSFIYDKSLPVTVKRGILNIKSDTKIINNSIDSKNSLSLREHELAPKGAGINIGFATVPVICQTLNSINPVDLDFDITGTLDKPEFKGFQDSLQKAIKPAITNIHKSITDGGIKTIKNIFSKSETESNKGAASVTEGGTEEQLKNAMGAVKSLFGGEKSK